MFTRYQEWFLKHKKELALILLVTCAAGFLRFYNLAPWLHFELDQARDAIVIDRATEGSVLDLPLLGPKAGGTFLRLGPAFYYLEYISAKLFGANVVGHMVLVTILGTLLVPLFYFFLRRAFTRSTSLVGALWLGTSLYAVLYSRFGWNPNFLPFFTLGGFWFLLYAVDKSLTTSRRKKALWGAALFLTIATQMHFLAFLALPTITVLFLVYKRPTLPLTAWGWAILIALFLYLPMVLNETKTGFANTSEFFGAVTEKSTKEEHPLLEKLVKNTAEYGLAEIVVLTGFEGASFPKVDIEGIRVTSIVCEGRCDTGKWYGILGVLFFVTSILALCYQAYVSSGQKRDFFALVLIWQGVAFALFTPLAFGIAPRFYLLSLPIFFVGALAVFDLLTKFLQPQWRLLLLCVLAIGVVSSNGYFIDKRFQELQMSRSEAITTAPDRILKEKTRVTLAQKKDIVEAIMALPEVTKKPLYFESTSQYKRAFKYLLRQKTIPTDGISPDTVYREGIYVYVLRTQSDIPTVLGRILESFDITEKKVFGTLTMIVLTPKLEAITAEKQIIVPPVSTTSNSLAPRRYTWREYLSDGQGEVLEVEIIEDTTEE
jgi:4-amino-4-deoxy-L-arabinose transferase-like glycosyltransferase